MILSAESGLWSTGSPPAQPPLAAVLEVSGAVLSWTVEGDPADPPEIAFTDPVRADWLWRMTGEAGHVALVDTLCHRDRRQPVELDGVAVRPGSAAALRRLALGHWLRRWWPASDRDGIAALDRAVLDAEIALLTVAAEDYFTDDTIDADPGGLLAPHLAALESRAADGDPRVVALVEECRELAAEIGLSSAGSRPHTGGRDDYALAAGPGERPRDRGAIAVGTATVHWSAVPPAIFDAAENTVDWSVVDIATGVTAVVQVALSGSGSAQGIPVTLRCGDGTAAGSLDADGRAVLTLLGADGAPLGAAQAWNTEWAAAELVVGAGTGESVRTRDRVRALARARLAAPPEDAFLAEILAAESDY
ncbi:hypothetical protein ACWDTP_15755 [Mycobacterium sp. NPDC003449]